MRAPNSTERHDVAQPEQIELEAEAVRAVAEDLLHAVRAHYSRRPVAASTVLEILNALAVVSAKVIQGTGNNECAVQFFIDALNQQIGQEAGGHTETMQ